MTQTEFERDFHSRTLAYLPEFKDDGRPVVVCIGADAHSVIGHALIVALTNQLARAHRRIVFIGDLGVPLRCRDLFGQPTLGAATIGLARAINPFIEAERADRAPTDALITLGVGDVDAELGLGADGWCALLGRRAPLDGRPHAIWGALYAACLGAAIAFHRQRGITGAVRGRFSLWQLGGTDSGPVFRGPLDLGRVLQVGAGAVGAALDYFVTLIGAGGTWRVVDGDLVDVSNLQRQLLYVAADAGYPDGPAQSKALRAAALMGPHTQGVTAYYDRDPGLDCTFDLVLALANDHDVRAKLQWRQPTVLLHATTGPAWEAFLHRHIAGHDDCIVCRIPGDAPRFVCAEGQGEVAGRRFDAALPFLSATGGLLLAAALARLQQGVLANGDANFWSVNLGEPDPLVRVMERECTHGCRMRLPPDVRMRVDRQSRYVGLDGAA